MDKEEFFDKFKIEAFIDLGVAGKKEISIPKDYKDVVWKVMKNNKVNLDNIEALSDDFELTFQNGVTLRFIRKEKELKP